MTEDTHIDGPGERAGKTGGKSRPTRRTSPVTPPDVFARHPSGRWFVLRGVGCVRTPVAAFGTLDEAQEWPELRR